MTIGIIGAGGIGQAYARQLLKAGYEAGDVIDHGGAGHDRLSGLAITVKWGIAGSFRFVI